MNLHDMLVNPFIQKLHAMQAMQNAMQFPTDMDPSLCFVFQSKSLSNLLIGPESVDEMKLERYKYLTIATQSLKSTLILSNPNYN